PPRRNADAAAAASGSFGHVLGGPVRAVEARWALRSANPPPPSVRVPRDLVPGGVLRGRRAKGEVRCDSPGARPDELGRVLAVGEVGGEGGRARRPAEVVDRGEKPARRRGIVDEVVEVEELDVSREVAEESEELGVAGEHAAGRAGVAEVVTADAFQREV